MSYKNFIPHEARSESRYENRFLVEEYLGAAEATLNYARLFREYFSAYFYLQLSGAASGATEKKYRNQAFLSLLKGLAYKHLYSGEYDDTDMTEPLRMTAKSEVQVSQADEPNDVPSEAATQGFSRVRRNCVGSLPSITPMPRAPITSGSRAPVDSPMWMNGMPLSVLTRRTCAIFFEFVTLVEAALTVKSLMITPTSRSSILAKQRRPWGFR